MSDAFAELLAVDEEVFDHGGTTIEIDGDDYDCFLPDQPSNFEWTGGGQRDAATPEVWILKSAFSGTPPTEGQSAIIDGRELVVLGPIVDRKAYYAITLGTTYES